MPKLLHLGNTGSASINAHTTGKTYEIPSLKGKREQPQCSHCGLQGHTIDHCYKLHGYPPGYKPRSKTQLGQAQANQATSVVSEDLGTTNMTLNSLSPSPCQQLIALLSSQLQRSLPAIVES